MSRDFPRPDFEPNISAFSQLKNERNLPKMVYIIPNFLVLHFGEKFMKIQTKIQMHDLYKNVNEIFLSFYEGQLKQLISYIDGF